MTQPAPPGCGSLCTSRAERGDDLAFQCLSSDRADLLEDDLTLAVDHEGLRHAVDAPFDCGTAIAVEVWEVPAAGLAAVLLAEPPGLSIGKVRLADGEETLGVLGEPVLCEGQLEITEYGGWRAYVGARAKS